MASRKLIEDGVVDDIISGGTVVHVQKFMGKEDPLTLQCDEKMPSILSKTKLYLKALACTGEKLGSAVLGMRLSTEAICKYFTKR